MHALADKACRLEILEVVLNNIVDIDKIESVRLLTEEFMNCLVGILGTHDDFSLLSSLIRLQSVTDTNPNFKKTLKNNAERIYCRSYIYENALYLYLQEMKLLFKEVKTAYRQGKEYDFKDIEEASRTRKNFFETPLSEMRRVEFA